MTNTSKTDVPELRFPEFDGMWLKNTLADITTHITSGSRDWAQYYSDSGDKFIRMTNLSRDGSIDIDLSELKYVKLPESGSEGERTSLNQGDILISITAELGKIGFVTSDIGKAYINQHTALVRPEQALVDPTFLAYSLARTASNKRLNRLNDSGAKAGLNLSTISQFATICPTIEEQQRISSFLSTVDDKIAQLTRKKALLEDYKKGCIQQIFSQKLRFKNDDGRDFPDWEEKQFREIFSWINTNSLPRENLTYDGGSVHNIHYGDIHTKFSANFHQTEEVVPYIKDASPSDFKSEQICQVGDVIIADASEDYADIGKAIEIVSLSQTPLVAGLHTYIARPLSEKVQTGFTGYLFQSPRIRRQITRIAQGISVLGISKGNLEKLSFLLPHQDEQRKIADILSALDKKINLVERELVHAQDFKKGLLQKMFV